ncbi:MAG: 4Fe-4S binding protein [candidate division WOR-3 bacterium]
MRPYRIGQVISTILLNAYVLAYLQHKIIYTGFLKRIPEPVLNCYGGPLSVFACPLGSLQSIIGIHHIPWLIIGTFILVGIVVGRMACAWVCPFGLWQDLLQKIPCGPRFKFKRWNALVIAAGIAALIAALVALYARLPVWKVYLFGWLPFSSLLFVVAVRGKTDIPERLWLGGFASALGLGVLVWLKFGASLGVVTGVAGMVLLGLTGRWFAAVTSAVAGALVVLLGPAFRVGPLTGPALAVLIAGLLLALVVIIDIVGRVKLPATFLKFGFLIVIAVVVAYKTGEPWFCKLCPQGTLEAGIPLVLWDPQHGLRSLVGWLYWVKMTILLLVIVAAIAIKRPFCRLICPIGAIYSVFNKLSLLHLEVDENCRKCQRCRDVCPMNIEVPEGANQFECIRCLECKYVCNPESVKVKF